MCHLSVLGNLQVARSHSQCALFWAFNVFIGLQRPQTGSGAKQARGRRTDRWWGGWVWEGGGSRSQGHGVRVGEVLGGSLRVRAGDGRGAQ